MGGRDGRPRLPRGAGVGLWRLPLSGGRGGGRGRYRCHGGERLGHGHGAAQEGPKRGPGQVQAGQRGTGGGERPRPRPQARPDRGRRQSLCLGPGEPAPEAPLMLRGRMRVAKRSPRPLFPSPGHLGGPAARRGRGDLQEVWVSRGLAPSQPGGVVSWKRRGVQKAAALLAKPKVVPG